MNSHGETMSNVLLLMPGDALMKEGDEATKIFYVKKGEMNVFVNRNKVGTVKSGEFVGEMAFITGEPRSATVIAKSECEVVEISRNGFKDSMDKLEPWVQEFIKTLMRRLKNSRP